ncbi:hypothetical protein KHP60_04685 [Microvirga sp. 3-52]|uniref:hypothetical protein n=1 Tax=Microvirga sp. 3-52 TaxID=2792425 RepID=UPI001AD4A4C5|nr:hypothetical protein [Microvirga sp. 3-52]MBO1904031.1 hypothetical protein [Microvirga sp. 3-52]MBS7451642.1 hypothetical protein [Microvirga sp. 3-52]
MNSLPRNWWDQLPIAVLRFQKDVQGTRFGWVDLEVPGLSLLFDACVVHRHTKSNALWVMPRAGLRFTDRDVWRRWSDRILRQLADRYPLDFSDFDDGDLP